MKYAAATIVLLFASLAVAQEVKHAPTIEQCQADANLWSVQSLEETDRLSVLTLEARWKEMYDCKRLDSSRDQRSVYEMVMHNSISDQEVRMVHFLERHHEWDQFVVEDAAGKR